MEEAERAGQQIRKALQPLSEPSWWAKSIEALAAGWNHTTRTISIFSAAI
jgi:hypothetical protein